MKRIHSLLAAAALAALAMGPAYAAGNASQDRDPGFNALDKNNDGYLSKAEAARNPELAKEFAATDGNHDGKLSRVEYLEAMAKKDLGSVKDKVGGLFNKKDSKQSSSSGSSAKP